MTTIYRILWAWGGAAMLGLASLAVAEVANARYRYTHMTLLVLATAILAAWLLTVGVCHLAPHLARAWLAAHGLDVSVRRDGWDPPPSSAGPAPLPPVLDPPPAGAAVIAPAPEPEVDSDPHAHCCRNAAPFPDTATAAYLKDAADLFDLARQVERDRLDPPDGELAR